MYIELSKCPDTFRNLILVQIFRCINLPAFDHKLDCLYMYSASAMLVMLYAINSVLDNE